MWPLHRSLQTACPKRMLEIGGYFALPISKVIVIPERCVTNLSGRWSFLEESPWEKLLEREQERGVTSDALLNIHLKELPDMTAACLRRAVSQNVAGIVIEPVTGAVTPEGTVTRRDRKALRGMPLDRWQYANAV